MTTQKTQSIDKVWLAFGRKVRACREQKGWSQQEAAERAGMKRQQWNRIEQGASTKRVTLYKIAETLGVDQNIVLDWAGFKSLEVNSGDPANLPALSDYIEEIVGIINRVPKPQRTKIIEVINVIYQEDSVSQKTGHTAHNTGSQVAPDEMEELKRVQSAIKDGVKLKPIELEPLEESFDPEDDEPFKKPHAKPASRLKIIWESTRRLQG